MNEALASLPASCCRDYPMSTCCCTCNLTRTVWGLSHYLIAKQGYDAAQVRWTVVKWLEFVNPKGFAGDACYHGGCGRAFADDGCGGMDENHLVTRTAR